ncbi:MAG: glycosyltransferase family 9 protein [Ignavibacteria bacterium]|nr:glycosyltransferase family 9 protein [Ignavibacteria bacterium]
MDNPDKILIIQTAFIGDVILTIPVAVILKREFPDVKIDFICIPSTKILLKNNPNVDNVFVFDKKRKDKGLGGMLRIIKLIRSFDYDWIIVPHRSFRSTVITRFGKCKYTVSFDKSALNFLYKYKIKYIQHKHEIIRNLTLLNPLGLYTDEIVRPVLCPDADDEKFVEKILQDCNIKNDEKLLTIAPGSVWYTKRFPEFKFAEIINDFSETDIPVILTGSKDDYDVCNEIVNLTKHNRIYNLAGKFNLLQTAELIRRTEILISNDSAPLHIANAVGTKVFAVFGATIPQFGFYPYGEEDKIFEIKNLKCRPCSIHGGKKCPVKTFDCMLGINTNEIILELKKFFNN